MRNKVYEIMHPNTGKKLTERNRGPYQDYSDCIDDDFSMYDGDYSIYDELDIFEDKELEEYILEEKIYNEFSQHLYSKGVKDWYRHYYNRIEVKYIE
jgi:hypothetical protein